MKKIFPAKLRHGDEIRIITPSRTLDLPFITQDVQRIAQERLAALGYKLSFGKHIHEKDMFSSSSIESRVEDLHDAFADKNVKAILTVIGGFNSNQILSYLDYDLIQKNPKILCGYSDITALQNTIFAKSGLVTYSGPHYFNFGEQVNFEYTQEYFLKCFTSAEPFTIAPAQKWSDDRWANDQLNRNFVDNDGWWIIQEGVATGNLIGGNLGTLQLLKGTEYMPSLENSLLFLEDDEMTLDETDVNFDRDLQSLIHLPDFKGVQAILIGRFHRACKMTQEKIQQIIASKEELDNIPVIANVDFGHTVPIITLPIGGEGRVIASKNQSSIEILLH